MRAGLRTAVSFDACDLTREPTTEAIAVDEIAALENFDVIKNTHPQQANSASAPTPTRPPRQHPSSQTGPNLDAPISNQSVPSTDSKRPEASIIAIEHAEVDVQVLRSY
eukprot:SAG31_NODE_2590_length_5426_cov_4.118265_8_plen_109_part_00